MAIHSKNSDASKNGFVHLEIHFLQVSLISFNLSFEDYLRLDALKSVLKILILGEYKG